MDFEDEVPQLVLDLQKKKEKALAECGICNGGGWLSETMMCQCLRKIMVEYRMLEANVPRNLSNKELKDYHAQKSVPFRRFKEFLEKIQTAREKGIGLYIYGPSGSGKSFLGVLALKHAIEQHLMTGFYIKTSHWIKALQDFEKNPHGEKVVEWGVMETDVLVLDDVGKYYKTSSGYTEAQVDRCIQKRVDDNKITIYTSEESMEDMGKRFGNHILSRLYEKMIEIMLPATGDFRKEVLSKKVERELLG